MQHSVNVEGFEGRQLVVESAGFFSGPRLMLDGKPASKGPKRGQLLLRRNDGVDVIAQLRGLFVDPIPQVTVDGKTIKIAEPLPWYVWVWSGLPIVLLFMGGALGGGLGAVAMMINGRIFRSDMHGALKFAITGAISLVTALVFFTLAIILNQAIRGR
ncbi:MAG TPA: hypothetical protein VKE41_21790 [Roseiflexaceae bacterium]|nr:hypothetical protein [Roseiflexaceae bacterium]